MHLIISSFLLIQIIHTRMIALYQRYQTYKIQCLQANNFTDQLFIYVYQDIQNPGTYYTSGNLTQINQKLGIQSNILFYPNTYPVIPLQQAINKYSTFLNKLSSIKMIWMYALFDSCQYLYNFVVGLEQKLNVPLGMNLDAQMWMKYFGSYEACSKFGSFPLYNYQRSYLKFRPFGGWTKYNFSQHGQSIDQVCGVSSNANEVFLWVQPNPNPKPNPDPDSNWKQILGIVFGSIIFLVVAFFIVRKYFCTKKVQKLKQKSHYSLLSQ